MLSKNLFLLPLLLFAFSPLLFSQKKNKKEKELENEIRKSLPSEMGNELAIRIASSNACKCIDSVNEARNNITANDDAIIACIDNVVVLYDMTKKLMSVNQQKSGKKPENINININKNSTSYINNFNEIQDYLKDSCSTYTKLIMTDYTVSSNSYSKNEEALNVYNQGITFFKEKNYKEAKNYFKRAIEIDEKFVFALDNYAICERQLGNYAVAIETYKKSLAIDSFNATALMNIGVVQQLNNEIDASLESYKKMIRLLPDNAEGYYGISIIYFQSVKNYALALDNMCKALIIYTKQKSAYKSEAESLVVQMYKLMQENKEEKKAREILNKNGIKIN
jgi:tetratricopeptide (TPR) repeat protein